MTIAIKPIPEQTLIDLGFVPHLDKDNKIIFIHTGLAIRYDSLPDMNTFVTKIFNEGFNRGLKMNPNRKV